MTKSSRLPHHQLGGGGPEGAQRYPQHTCPAPRRIDICLGSALRTLLEMEVPVRPVADNGGLRGDIEHPPEATGVALHAVDSAAGHLDDLLTVRRRQASNNPADMPEISTAHWTSSASSRTFPSAVRTSAAQRCPLPSSMPAQTLTHRLSPYSSSVPTLCRRPEEPPLLFSVISAQGPQEPGHHFSRATKI